MANVTPFKGDGVQPEQEGVLGMDSAYDMTGLSLTFRLRVFVESPFQ